VWLETACRRNSGLSKTLSTTTERLTPIQRWCLVRSQGHW
jgi:hypothetical protein